ncbi:MAG TPA: hypothetical protein VFG39_02565 [Balneolaceae bacterium]|nr:hypothetical protein [Balneolaceae bacterium]
MLKTYHPAYVYLKFILLFSTGLIFSACNSSPKSDANNVLARVGKEHLTVQKAVKVIPDFVLKRDSIGALKRYRDEWIQDQILLQEAYRLGLDQKEEVRQKLEKARKEILRQALKTYIIGSLEGDKAISDQEARSYYQTHKDKFALNEKFVRFRHMSARTSADARAAKRDLLYAVPWPEVARKYAIHPKAVIQDSKQYWPLSMAANNVDIMNRYLHIIGHMEISPIQRVDGVYHFVQLIDERAKGEHPDLNWLIGQIKDWMLLNKRNRHFKSYVQNLYLKAQSNNEVETFNVLPVNPNQKLSVSDTLEITSTNE